MIVFDTGHRLPKPFTVMAEAHPPSPKHIDKSIAWEIAGQARYDGLMGSL